MTTPANQSAQATQAAPASNVIPLAAVPPSPSPEAAHRAEIRETITEAFEALLADPDGWDSFALVCHRDDACGCSQPFARYHARTGFHTRVLPEFVRSVLTEAVSDAGR